MCDPVYHVNYLLTDSDSTSCEMFTQSDTAVTSRHFAKTTSVTSDTCQQMCVDAEFCKCAVYDPAQMSCELHANCDSRISMPGQMTIDKSCWNLGAGMLLN